MAVDRINKRKQREQKEKEKKEPPMNKKNTFTDLDYIWKFAILLMLGLVFYALD